MKNLKKGFTLVELIVVITILAILGTIAFISLQGYSADARNSKRVSDLGSIGGAISIKLTQGVGLLAFVNSGSLSQVPGISIGGSNAIPGTDYQAGTVNYTAVGIKKEDFQDPNAIDYVGGVTTKINGKYQFAAKMEQGGGAFVAKIFGDYTPRTFTGTLNGVTNSVTVNSIGSNNTVNIPTTDIGKIREGDTVTGGRSVAKVSADGIILTLSGATFTATGSAALFLNATESAGLIDANGATVGTVTDGGTVLPY